MRTLTVSSGGTTRGIETAEGGTLLSALRDAGYFVDAPCGGQGHCGKCGVWANGQWRLACRTRIDSDLSVTVPGAAPFFSTETGDLEEQLKALDHTPLGTRAGGAATGVSATGGTADDTAAGAGAAGGHAKAAHGFGIAVDLGTTTVSLALLDLSRPAIIGSLSFYNPQIVYGADVINRIIFSLKGDGREVLKRSILKETGCAILHLCRTNGVPQDRVRAVSVAGNTAMQHFLMGLDARYIREEPYEPIVRNFPPQSAAELIPSLPAAELHLLPCVANYLGADMVAGTAACGLRASRGPSVLLDIGTNGEMVIGGGEWLMGCACSAGPAFEGMGLSCGMRYRDGAVIDVTAEGGKLRYTVAGGGAPAGISGAGAVGLIAGLKDLGFIDGRGKFTAKVTDKAGSRRAYILSEDQGGRVFVDETDIDNIIRAKAAIFAGLNLMLKKLSLGLKDVEHFYVAGGIGNALVMGSAVKLGLLPPLSPNRMTFSGNTSLQGAVKYLISESFRREVLEISRSLTYVDLSYEPAYMDEYMAALFIPHTDAGLFISAQT